MEGSNSKEIEKKFPYLKWSKVINFAKTIGASASRIIIETAVVVFLSFKINALLSKPDIRILGVVPISVTYSINKTTDSGLDRFLNHTFNLIVKVENKSSIPVAAHLVKIEGCIKISPALADTALPKSRQFKGGPSKTFFDKYRNSVRRLEYSGIVTEDSKIISQNAFSYIGIKFPIKGQGGSWSDNENEKSISINGECNEIKSPHTQISLIDIFEEWSVHQGPPKKLRREIKNGSLRMSLFAGAEQITIESEKIKKLYHLSQKNWENLLLPQMYETPDDTYYPPEK